MGLFGTIGYWLSGLCIWLAPLAGVAGLLYAVKLYRGILVESVGGDTMHELQREFGRGFETLLKDEGRHFVIAAGAVFLLLLLLPGISFWTAVCFIFGAVSAAAAVIAGMAAVHEANVRAAEAAKTRERFDVIGIAYAGGGVAGISAASLGIVGVGFLFYFFASADSAPALVGFAFGALLITLFPRHSSGSDLRAAHRGADIFGSYFASLIATILIAASISIDDLQSVTSFSPGLGDYLAAKYRFILMGTPLVLVVFGLIASVVAVESLKNQRDETTPEAFMRAERFATMLFLGLALAFVVISPLRIWVWIAIAAGALAYNAIEKVLELTNTESHRDIRRVWTSVAVLCFALFAASLCAGVYGIGIAAVSLTGTAGLALTVNVLRRIAESAARISESGGLGENASGTVAFLDQAAKSMLDHETNYASISASIATFALLFAFALRAGGTAAFPLGEPAVVIGLLIGAILPAIVVVSGQTTLARIVSADVLRADSVLVPGTIALELPILLGLLLGSGAVGGLVGGAAACGLALSLFLDVSADSAPVKGTESAVNILMKMMAIVALVIAPLI